MDVSRRRLAGLLGAVLLSLVAGICNAGVVSSWEKVAQIHDETVETVNQDFVAVDVDDGYLYVALGKTSTVKVFTILGQLVSEQKLESGTWRIKLPDRGIYILKAGSQTCRVTL